MGRVAKKAPEPVVEDSPTQTITQTRTRRTPKPNPKYANESIIVPPKIDTDELGESDDEDKPAEVKIAKSTKKNAETPAAKGPKTPAAKAKAAAAAKKQKLEFDDEEAEDDEKPVESDKATPRSTRSAKGADPKDTLKIGDESVAIVDVSSIISKAPVKAETPKPMPRGAGRKRAVPEESPKEDQAKKKKEDDKPSLITARKSYMPAKKDEAKDKEEDDDDDEEHPEVKEESEKAEVPKTPAMKTRRNVGAAAESPQSEPAEKKIKVEVAVKAEETPKTEPKKLPVVRRNEPITKYTPIAAKVATPVTLPTKVINNNTVNTPKPIPRILNSMVTPKGKQSPNVKLAGDGTDKKVYSIDLTDDSIKEKKIIMSPVKSPPVRPSPVAVKENIANNKPQPSMVLKNKLESELMRMKASANNARRQVIPATGMNRQSLPTHANTALGGARRITKFESWYVIDVKNVEPTPFRHTHSHSLIKLGNDMKELQLPSAKWDYKITMQRRKQNNNEEEIYTGDCGGDKLVEANREDYEPASILFKRNHRDATKTTIDRSLMLKQNMFTITMNGKQCKLIGAPDDISSIEDVEILLNIIDSSNLQHSCVELVTQHDVVVA
jgi:hypothetical protein